ncbi:(2Fe-2S)-binding protein [Paucibacter sp. APW11]|uniref:Bacterioferritin-associated ferredoxin n=1 Tax=Roseateles aquae TaxID=3077235 RepID=A0ABU3PGQ4_9BURK|nr:(2Fe-2S)-binding protein [Paucibacter sp. APW11]MDT9001303.1 (2Fe-2S)-binding protein [Paucibacter sp. APW11]
MIVCLCHRVSDRDIRRHVEAGTANFEQLQDDTQLASACGACHDCAHEIFEAALSERVFKRSGQRVIAIAQAVAA